MFKVQFIEIIKDEIPPKRPKIIQEKGESPEQYPYYDDEEE